MIENNCSLNKKYNNRAAKKPISGVIKLKKYNWLLLLISGKKRKKTFGTPTVVIVATKIE